MGARRFLRPDFVHMRKVRCEAEDMSKGQVVVTHTYPDGLHRGLVVPAGG